ncbi:hypothetical protein GCM10009111_25700 [Colwellia asteriadis]|uniref:Uncharacterized protein n=1 Tax=Colwellia asteriadis TaxID=517723 RepID=A0ABN1L8Z2_9GAMM
MTASVTPIRAKKTKITAQPELALVVSVDTQGKIEQVQLSTQGTTKTVSGQAKHISCAAHNDMVLVLNTGQGLMVIALIAKPSDSPAAHISDNNGHVTIKGAKSVSLSTEKGSIEVYQDGRIVLDATEVNANSERDFSIAGWPIRLN